MFKCPPLKNNLLFLLMRRLPMECFLLTLTFPTIWLVASTMMKFVHILIAISFFPDRNMAIESETIDVSLRRRKMGTFSNQSSSSDLLNNNNSDSSDDYKTEKDFDADTSTLNPNLTKALEHTTDRLTHNETLSKLKEVGAKTPILASEIGTDFSFKRKVVWSNAIGFLVLHLCALIGVGLVAFGYTRLYTVIYSKYH